MLWKLIAKLAATDFVSGWLIRRGIKRPYTHIYNDGQLYMSRYWIFNPYQLGTKKGPMQHLPSIRLHHIVKPDDARHHHDHPWNARTVILRGAYAETRLETLAPPNNRVGALPYYETKYLRLSGDTAKIGFGEYHTITAVSGGGAWTLFITWKYRGTWGFLVDGVKVHYKKYLGVKT